MMPLRALATVHVMVSTYGENEDEEESIVIFGNINKRLVTLLVR